MFTIIIIIIIIIMFGARVYTTGMSGAAVRYA